MIHTPEPWKLWLDESITEGLPAVVAEHPITHKGKFFVAQCNTIPDTQRIVACVNGCAGLNPTAYRELVEATKQTVKDLHHESVIPAWCEVCDMELEGCCCCIKDLKTALAHAQRQEG